MTRLWPPGYIIVFQDVRGKYGSEGDYVMRRALSKGRSILPTDWSTITPPTQYDTIDWLVKHVPESNGRVATDRWAPTKATPRSCPRSEGASRTQSRSALRPDDRWLDGR